MGTRKPQKQVVAFSDCCRFTRQSPRRLLHFLEKGSELLPFGRELDLRARLAIEELDAQFLFERVNVLGYGWLRIRKLRGSEREALVANNREDHIDFLEIHSHHLSG